MIISTENLTKHFGATLALESVSCAIEPGTTGLLGPNGAGKTTLLRILLGLLPAKGKATVLDIDPMRQPLAVRARLGYMPESECLIPGLTGVEAVSFMGRISGMPSRAALQRAHEVLYFVGLGEARYREVGEFSTGMQQRLKLAQALVHDPDLLFLDEPTNGLDPKGRQEMLAVVKELAVDHKKSVVLSSHLLPDVEAVCTNVVLMNRGRIVRAGPLAELTSDSDGSYSVQVRGDEEKFAAELASRGGSINERRVHLPDDAGTRLIFEAAAAAEVQLREVKPMRRSLEDVFMEAMDE
ncbi:MAG: ABC transporter ATP-binding protein [Planctomycetota bacterium]